MTIDVLRAYARKTLAPQLVRELLRVAEAERDEIFRALREAFCLACGAAKTVERPDCPCTRDE